MGLWADPQRLVLATAFQVWRFENTLADGDIVHWIRIEGAATELYDVAVLPGLRRPMAASFTGAEINEPMTFEMEEAHLPRCKKGTGRLPVWVQAV
jgi:hypothetical protein